MSFEVVGKNIFYDDFTGVPIVIVCRISIFKDDKFNNNLFVKINRSKINEFFFSFLLYCKF